MSGRPEHPSTPATPRRYHVGEFDFDPATGELSGPSGRARLRQKASRALELLAEGGGALVTRDELRREIWGETHVDFGQGLNTCIKEVRMALADDAETPRYVETLRRRGYRLIARVERMPAGHPVLAQHARTVEPPPRGRRVSSAHGRLAAAAIATLLLIGSSAHVTPELATRSRTNTEASIAADHETERLLARGRHLLRTRDPGALERSLRLLEAAAVQSPRDGRAWSALADVHRVLADRDPGSRARHRAEASRAAARAVELDPGLAAAHASLGGVLEDEGRLGEAEAEYKRAVQLEPAEPTARQWLSTLLFRQGRLDEAYLHARAARAADPLSPGACTSLAYVHLLRGEVAPARAAFEEALSLEPQFAAARLGLARVHMVAQEWDEALAALERAGLPDGLTRSERAYALARSGRTAEARLLLQELIDQEDQRVYDIAAIHASLGDRDEALAWLESAVEAGAVELRSLPADPRFAPLRGEPRFNALMHRAALSNGGVAARPGD